MTIKKTSIIASLVLFSTLILGACGNTAEVTTDTTNNDSSNDIEYSKTGEDPADIFLFEFKKFELEVDYPNQEEAIDVNYEEKKDSTEAEFESIADDVDATSDDAMAKLRPLLEKLELKEVMKDEEILTQIIKAFNIEDNYTKIEADITWDNGEEIKITSNK